MSMCCPVHPPGVARVLPAGPAGTSGTGMIVLVADVEVSLRESSRLSCSPLHEAGFANFTGLCSSASLLGIALTCGFLRNFA